jgi:uncharacterized Zn-binding protein involved in type VI secretion
MRHFILVGDPISHGGEVIEGGPFSGVRGRRIARVGDQVSCRKHGKTSITTGDPHVLIDGRPAARHGDECACGATLIAKQATSGIA